MKDPQQSPRKLIPELRKHSLSERTRPNYQQPECYQPLMGRGIKSLGWNYVQDNIFKVKQKEHHEIIISDEVVKNSKLYRMLREKIEIKETQFDRQYRELVNAREKVAEEINQIKANNYQTKINIWEMKNNILELKNILREEQQENQQLQQEKQHPQGAEGAEEEELELEGASEENQEEASEENRGEESRIDVQECEGASELSSNEREREQQLKNILSQLSNEFKINPQNNEQNL